MASQSPFPRARAVSGFLASGARPVTTGMRDQRDFDEGVFRADRSRQDALDADAAQLAFDQQAAVAERRQGIGSAIGGTLGAIGGGIAGTFVAPGAGTIAGGLAGAKLGAGLGSSIGGGIGGATAPTSSADVGSRARRNQRFLDQPLRERTRARGRR